MYKNSRQRFREIVKVLAFYGFGYLVDSKLNKERNSPSNLRKAFEELGPTFIKIGQILSTRPDLLSSAYIHELSKLQDCVITESYENMNQVFYGEFLQNIEQAFQSFDPVPFASASVAQVHKALLKDGREVIVKIQRPAIHEKMKLDLVILHKLIQLTKARFTDALIDPEDAIEELRLSMERELDFKYEAKNMQRFKELNSAVACIYCPSVISELSSSKVLTMEQIDGIKIDHIDTLKEEGYDLEDIGRKLILSYFKQIFEDGFFHGDPHPGNLLIKGGHICYIDFGIIGILSTTLKETLYDMLLSVALKDINQMISSIMSISIKTGHVNRSQLYEDVDYLYSNYLSTSLENIKVSVLLNEIYDIAKTNNLKFPKDLTLLIKGLIIIEGVVTKIAPEIKILDIAIPYVETSNRQHILKHFKLNKLLLHTYRITNASIMLPEKLLELSDSILNGRIKVQLQHNSLHKPLADLHKMVNRLVFGLVTSSMIIGSSLILNTHIGPTIYDISIIGITGFIIAAFFSLWLLISIIKSGKM